MTLPILAALGLLDANDPLRVVDMLDLQPHHLARPQAAAIAEAEQHADLEARGDGQQAPRLVRAHHLRDLLRLTEVIDRVGQSSRRSVTQNKNRSPVMMQLRVQMLTPVSARCSWKRRISSRVAVFADGSRNAANRLQLRMWPALRARAQLARIHIFDHTLTQRGDSLGCHGQLLS